MPDREQILQWVKESPTEFEEALHLMQHSAGRKPSDRVRSIDPWRGAPKPGPAAGCTNANAMC